MSQEYNAINSARTINDMWAEWADHKIVRSKEVSEEQRELCRALFYAGAVATLHLITKIADDIHKSGVNNGDDRIEALLNECELFVDLQDRK